ncbi:MAG: hypothetical protein ACOYU7_10940 [Bacillota bacterium]|uniref:hypothetical protein n=1 Tax=unclassified Candidatus Desulforudis TaxID=2635950 RepID=UPI003BC18A81
MSKIERYKETLRALHPADWETFLKRESELPGKRANLELAAAAADLGDRGLFERLAARSSEDAPENSPEVFLVFCGVIGLGQAVARGDHSSIGRLRSFASDPRWRVREGVAMALQRVGLADMPLLLDVAENWLDGNLLELRAVAAGLCEPALLKDSSYVLRVLRILDGITRTLAETTDRKTEAFRVLKQALAYCWSVAVAAWPEGGKPFFERWARADDPDVRWIIRENLKKKRLANLDPGWVEGILRQVSRP